jgi:hypothetical protein
MLAAFKQDQHLGAGAIKVGGIVEKQYVVTIKPEV